MSPISLQPKQEKFSLQSFASVSIKQNITYSQELLFHLCLWSDRKQCTELQSTEGLHIP